MSATCDTRIASLHALLQGLCGQSLAVSQLDAVDAAGHGVRAILTPQALMLPAHAQSIVLHASVAHAAAHLLFSQPSQDVSGLKPMGVAVVSMIEDARVERLLIRQYPGAKRWFLQAMQTDQETLSSEFSVLLARAAHALLDEQAQDDQYWVQKACQLFKAQESANGLEDYAGFRALASILANDLGQMRMQFNAQQYRVPVVYRDDNSFLWDFGEDAASEDLSIEAPQSTVVHQAATDLNQDNAAPQAASQERYLYPEWDARLDILRQDWCTVIEYALTAAPVYAQPRPWKQQARLSRMPLELARALGRDRVFRQREGDALDMTAAVDTMVQRRRGADTDDRHYIRRHLRSKKTSVLLLLDLSASVTDLIAGSMHCILDIEKQAALLIAGMALEMEDRIAIHGFSSDTRAGVHYYRFLDFGQNLTHEVLDQLGRAQGQYSTRMGAAIRHAGGFFKDEPTDQQAMIVLTDGAPSDIDVFSPDYLVNDAARAVRQTVQAQVYGLVMDAGASDYARTIFGTQRYRMIHHAEKLSHHLTSVYGQLRANAS